MLKLFLKIVPTLRAEVGMAIVLSLLTALIGFDVPDRVAESLRVGFLELFVIIFGALELAESAEHRRRFFGSGTLDLGLLFVSLTVPAIGAILSLGLEIVDPLTGSFLSVNAVPVVSKLHATANASRQPLDTPRFGG